MFRMSSVFIVAIIINAMFSEMTAAASLFDQGYQFPKTGKSHKILKKLKAIHSQPETPPIPCPTESHKSIFIWVIGQSNAGNSVGHRFESETSLVFFQGHCYVAMDPMLGNYGKSGSVWLPMLDKLASATNKKPIVKATVVGGSKIQHWVNPDALKPFYKFHALQLKKFGISPDFILFIQGESNRARKHEKTYYPNLKEFIELIKKDFPLSIIGLSKTSYTKGNIGAHVRAAQE